MSATTKCPDCDETGCTEHGYQDCVKCEGTGRISTTTADEIWNAAIDAAQQIADEASSGKGALWYPHDDGEEPNGGDVLDRLPRAIRELKRNTDV